MKFYLFLANLLFGITLLTFAVASSHYLGIVLLRNQTQMPDSTRRQIRYFLLIGFISISMFLFFDKVIGMGARSFRFGAEVSRIEDIMPRLLGEQEPPKNSKDLNSQLISQNSITLFTQRTPAIEGDIETARSLKSLNLHLKYLTHLSTTHASEQCERWIQKFTENGVKIDRSITAVEFKRLFSDKKTAVLCLNEPFTDDELKSLQQWVFEGGSLILLGRPGKSPSTSLSTVLGVEAWVEADHSSQSTFVFGGPELNMGGNSGSTIALGSDWSNAPGFGLARVSEGIAGAYLLKNDSAAGAFSSNGLSNESPIVFSEYGKGRAFWTSLPPTLYGKLALLYDDLWKHIDARVLTFAFDLPIGGLSEWKSKGLLTSVLAIHAEYKIDQILKLLPSLHDLGAHASAYFVLSEAEEDPKTVQEWLVASNEVGFSFIDHQPISALSKPSSGEIRDYYQRMLNWAEKAVAKNHFGKAPYGVMLFPGLNATLNHLSAAMDSGLSYTLGDPFAEKLSPYHLQSVSTSEIVPFYPDQNNILTHTGSGSLDVLATPLGDDIAWGNASESELRLKFEWIQNFSRWAGSPALYKIHSQSVGKLANPINQFMRDQSKSTEWKTAADLMNRSHLLSQIKVTTQWKDSNNARVELENLNSEAVLNLVLKVPSSRRWSAVNSNIVDEQGINRRAVSALEIEIPRLESGEKKSFTIVTTH